MSFALAVLPLLLIIATGYALARSGVLPDADWKGIEILSFRVLIPAVLILAISGSDLSSGNFGALAAALMLTCATLVLVALATRLLPRARLSDASFTSVFQGGVRWNAFVALAAAEQFVGPPAIAALAVAIALLIPTLNICCIVVLTTFGPGRSSAGQIALAVPKNPLVQACGIGLGLYAFGITLPGPVVETLEMIGRGALAVGLLAVGAGISLRRLARWDWKVGLTLLYRPLLAPLIFVGFALWFTLDPMPTLVGVLVFAAPAASNGYIVAKQMGGDADLYADVLTWQTVLSLVVLPIWAWVVLAP